METLDQVATANGYTNKCTLGPASGVSRIAWSEGDTGAFVAQFWRYVSWNDDGTGNKYEFDPQEFPYPQSTNGAYATNVAGVRFRSAAAGTPATISAQLMFPTDPQVYSGAPTTSVVTTGSLNIEHNGALVGTQPTLDVVDAACQPFTVTNDAANSRVLLEALGCSWIEPVLSSPTSVSGYTQLPISSGAASDPTSLFSISGNEVVVARSAIVVISASIVWQAAASGTQYLAFQQAGVGYFAQASADLAVLGLISHSVVIPVTAGFGIEFWANQNAHGSWQVNRLTGIVAALAGA